MLIQMLRTGDAIFLYAYFERASVFCVDRALYFAVAANIGAPRYIAPSYNLTVPMTSRTT
jgi:hypothetical protein